MQKCVAISGGRDLPESYRPLVAAICRKLAGQGYSLITGDARGADQFAREAVKPEWVFTPAQIPGNYSYAQKLMRRSFKMVETLYVDSVDRLLVAFPTKPCPAGMPVPAPDTNPQRYVGFGSGTWSTIAYAVSLGLPVTVLACGFESMPADWGWTIEKHGRYTYYCLNK